MMITDDMHRERRCYREELQVEFNHTTIGFLRIEKQEKWVTDDVKVLTTNLRAE